MNQERESVRAWASALWREPVGVVFFKRKRFKLNLPNRSEIGTWGIGKKVLYVLAFPLFIPYALVMYVLDYWDIHPNWPTRIGTLTVRGTLPYGQAVEFVDLMKKCPKSSWVAFSRSHVALLRTGFDQQAPHPFWLSGPEVTVELVSGAEEGVVRFYWPENGMAVMKLSEEEDVIVKNYAQLHGAGWSRFV